MPQEDAIGVYGEDVIKRFVKAAFVSIIDK